MIAPYLRRGLAAGLLAGLLAGVFAFFVGEPLLDRAIALEEQPAAHGHGAGEAEHSHGGGEEVFGRATQKVGLFFATGLSGTFLGGLFGMVFAFFRGRMEAGSDWGRSLSLAAAIFAGFALIPFLKYPANPPTVGDPETIGARTAAYFTLVAVSLLGVLISWYAARALRERGVGRPARQISVGIGLAAFVVLLLLVFPATSGPGDFPAGLLWSFRLSSIGTQLVLWTGLGAVFGLLCERANRKSGVA
jgi:predicted cobalt transporter CbtA